MNFVNTFTNRTFGIEMEFVNREYERDEIARKITAAGVECYAEMYNHTTRQWWKIVTDSSCGFELVSPPLSGAEAFEQIKIVCDVLNECGSIVNKSCGLHVHHNASDFTLDTFKNLYNLYTRFENVIDSMMPKSRRVNNNLYCRSLYNRRIPALIPPKQIIDCQLQKIKNCTTVEELRNVYGRNRYHKLNLESYVKHGTIEFRQHSGTLDAEKIINWVVLTQAMINTSFTKISVWEYNDTIETVGKFFKRIHITGNYTDDIYMNESREFFKKRIKYFRKEEGEAA